MPPEVLLLLVPGGAPEPPFVLPPAVWGLFGGALLRVVRRLLPAAASAAATVALTGLLLLLLAPLVGIALLGLLSLLPPLLPGRPACKALPAVFTASRVPLLLLPACPAPCAAGPPAAPKLPVDNPDPAAVLALHSWCWYLSSKAEGSRPEASHHAAP